MLSLILLVFAFVFAVIAFMQVGDPVWRKLMAASLAAFFLACIFGHKVISDKITQQRPIPDWLAAEGWPQPR